MRVLFLATSISRFGGGVSEYIVGAARSLINCGCDVHIFTITDPFFKDDCPEDLKIEAFERTSFAGRYAYSRKMKLFAMQNCHSFDIIHTHTTWNYQLLLGRQIAAKHNKKLVCSVHGMLEPYCMKISTLKKQLLLSLYGYNIFNHATCLHITGLNEYNTLKSLPVQVPVGIIPIGLDVSRYGANGSLNHCQLRRLVKDKKVLLFLSRISPIKGLDILAKAWGRICKDFPNWLLVIAGPDERGHLAQVQNTISEFGAESQTTFTGPVYGDLKRQLYSSCDLFILPTYSENFGIVIAEALASGKPVITTKGTPWSELETYNCGWYIDIGIEPLEKALREALNLLDSQRQEMGQRGRKLIEENYSWPKIAAQMIDVYKWVLGQGKRPDCVRLD